MRDIYEYMGWDFQSSCRSVLHTTPARNSLGKAITFPAFDGIKRYSIYSQWHPIGRAVSPVVMVRWPIVHGTGVEPTLAQKVVSFRGHPFRLNKSSKNYSYSSDAWANCCPYRIWMYLSIPLDVAASASRFDAWSVVAHVRANHQSRTRVFSQWHRLFYCQWANSPLPKWLSSASTMSAIFNLAM